MPLGKRLDISSDEARRRRAELRTSYGNKLSNMNLGRLPNRSQASSLESTSRSRQKTTASISSLRRIASSFAHVSDINNGSRIALPHEDTEEDAREERAEVLIRSEPFKRGTAPGKGDAEAASTAAAAAASTAAAAAASTAAAAAASTAAAAAAAAAVRAAAKSVGGAAKDSNRVRAGRTSIVEEPRTSHQSGDVIRSRATERWGQIADIVSTLFRVRRNIMADPLSELRRLREQRDLLEAFTRPFLYEDEGQR